MDLVVAQNWVAIGLNPDSRHGIVKDLIVLDDAQATVVDQDPTILTSPDLVLCDGGITARSVADNQS